MAALTQSPSYPDFSSSDYSESYATAQSPISTPCPEAPEPESLQVGTASSPLRMLSAVMELLSPRKAASPMEASPMSQGSALEQLAAMLQAGEVSEEAAETLFKCDDKEEAPTGAEEHGQRRVQVYYMQVKNGVMQIVGTITSNDKVVVIKAQVCEVVSAVQSRTAAYTEAAWTTVQAKTMWLQNGYVYISATIEGKVVLIKAKALDISDIAKMRFVKTFRSIEDFTEPLTSRASAAYNTTTSKAVAVYDSATTKATAVKDFTSSKAAAVCDVAKSRTTAVYGSATSKAHGIVVQPLKPYYLRVHKGVAYIVATVGNKVVVIRVRLSDFSTSIRMRVAESSAAAQAVIQRLTSPLMTRVLIFKNGTFDKIEHLNVSIRSGVVRVQSAVGERTILVQAKLSDVIAAIRSTTSSSIDGTRKAISDLAAKLATMASSRYGEVTSSVKMLYISTKEGILHIACQVNSKILVLRIHLVDLLGALPSMPRKLYISSSTAIANGYGAAKIKALQVTEFTRNKSLEVGTNVRSVAGNQQARVTAVAAVGGAVAVGAGGGAAGLMTGGGIGAGCGLLLAPFTLGLSIPLGAAVGGGAGLVIGTTAGSTAGFVAGGTAGYGVHKHKDNIGNGVTGAYSKAKAYKALAAASSSKLCVKVMGSTGGTATA